MWRSNNARRLAHLCLFLAGCYCGGPALASMVDFSETTDDIWFAVGTCLTAGGLGFGLGAKIRFTRDIANAA